MQIKDIYTGKPDAKDEIATGHVNEFVESFILPPNCELKRITDGDYCFIVGYKGTGKTALLRYIENKVKESHPYSCSSFLLFKEDLSEIKRQEFEENSKRFINSISIDKNLNIQDNDYQFVWKYFFLRKILSDNEKYSDQLFENDKEWTLFKQKMEEIVSLDRPTMGWFSNLKVSISFPIIKFSTEIDGKRYTPKESYRIIINKIEEAENLLSQTHRTQVPYYIFVDELEAYFATEKVFIRDLQLIRDLLFIVHKYNNILGAHSFTKIICAVRQEILNSIYHKIDSRELNKIIFGFSQYLNWEYHNTNSIQHPIIQILLKRIMTSRKAMGLPTDISLAQLYSEWFPDKIYDKEPTTYILNNCWNKPRDIVRMLISAQNSTKREATAFYQSVFDSFRKTYSAESLNEMKEELSALYSNQEIEEIVSCFNGFQISFSLKEIQEHWQILHPTSPLTLKVFPILRDLFRIGFIGNISPLSHQHRWHHRGDDDLQVTDDWNIYVHQALHPALSLTRKRDYQKSLKPKVGETVDVTIKVIYASKILVNIEYKGSHFKGCVHITEISDSFVQKYHLESYVSVGERKKARIIRYNSQYHSYDLSLKL